MRMYALVDCNNFFVSCERSGDPSLDYKPVVVLSNNDGNAVARSQEAKDLGIKMGQPAFELKGLIKSKGLIMMSSNYQLYGDMSDRVFNIASSFGLGEPERYSVDELFIFCNGSNSEYLQIKGMEMHKKIFKSTRIPVSVGFAPTKALAKIANKIAKKYPERCQNSYIIDTEEKRVKALKWTKVEDVWGIGSAYAGMLKQRNVITAYDFTQLPDKWVKSKMKIVGLRLKKDLQGISSIFMEDIKPKQGIMTSRSFSKTTDSYDFIKERTYTYGVWASEKLRKEKSRCTTITVSLGTNYHNKTDRQRFVSITKTLDFPTSSSIEIGKQAVSVLERLYHEGYRYKKVSVYLSGITPEQNSQLSFFNCENPKETVLMKVIDGINLRHGKNSVVFGGMDIKSLVTLRQENLSKKYTTSWNELISINCK